VIPARTRAEALEAISSRDVAAAVLDLVLGDDTKDLCNALADRGIPYVIYSGMPKPSDASSIFIEKPASSDRLVNAIRVLLSFTETLMPAPAAAEAFCFTVEDCLRSPHSGSGEDLIRGDCFEKQ
jgi:DNA-binding response OmpR family regulator